MAWPTDWTDRQGEDGCAMCREGRPERIPHGVRVHSGALVDGYVGTRAAQRGYVVATWRGRHVNDLTELSGAFNPLVFGGSPGWRLGGRRRRRRRPPPRARPR